MFGRAVLVACLVSACSREAIHPPPRSRPVSGRLVISGFGADADRDSSAGPAKHTLVLVPGVEYDAMLDNDIRGFPNGRYVHGWNQVGQIHVRLGRSHHTSLYGEKEILRTLQRWGQIPLPTDARFTKVVLEVVVETGARAPVDVMLYEVHRDWNPGSGGVQRDNTSPPAPGEVWWLDAAHGEVEWSLPGAGFASDQLELADVAPLALATAHYEPGASKLVFSSDSLSRYVQRRISSSKPLLFLLKLSDSDEDLGTAVISLYSAEEGDSFGTSRRPKLTIEWRPSTEVARWERDVVLENGRSVELRRRPTNGAKGIAISFDASPGGERPTIEVRGGTTKQPSEWRSGAAPFEMNWDWVQVRLVAAKNPVLLGTPFESELRDTWVTTAKPEEQEVTWTFISPLGKKTELRGSYEGDYRWQVAFRPKIPGRWSYHVRHELTWQPYESEQGLFDVIGEDPLAVLSLLGDLEERIEASNLDTPEERFERFGDEFLRLERVGIQLLTPDEFRSEMGTELSSRIDEIRRELGDAALPERPTAHGDRY